MSRTIVVVGAGAAGLASIQALRRRGWSDDIVLLGAEALLPYDRPPLSKRYLNSDMTQDEVALITSDGLAALGVRAFLDRPAVSLSVEDRVVHDGHGVAHHFEACIIATGVHARSLAGWDNPDLHELRTAADATRLRGALRPGLRLVIIGGGFIGLETAATAHAMSVPTTIVEPQHLPLGERVGLVAARRLLDMHRERGVTVRTGQGVTGVVPAPVSSDGTRSAVHGVQINDGTTLWADAVLIAIGTVPSTDWLGGSGLRIDDGVVCDEFLQAAPGVWAVGDVARWYHPVLGRHLRVEHRTNCTEQAQAVAAAIVSGETRPFCSVPFFWSDQYDVRLQLAGVVPPGGTEIVDRLGDGMTSFLVRFVEDGALRGVLGWNAARALMPYRRQLEQSANESSALRAARSTT